MGERLGSEIVVFWFSESALRCWGSMSLRAERLEKYELKVYGEVLRARAGVVCFRVVTDVVIFFVTFFSSTF